MYEKALPLLAIDLLLFTSPALAQDSPPAANQGLSDIVVTAQRREENLQDVPIAITVLSQEQLEQFRIFQPNDLQRYVPSLRQFFGQMLRNTDQITIRSLPGVVTYFAEAPVDGTGPGSYYDLANIQVLKGPQGTLFGGTATGGAILLEPRRPSNKFEGYVRGAIGNYHNREIEGALNIPIIPDKLMVRGAFTHQKREGFTKDAGPFFEGKDYDNRNHWAWRLGITARPFEGFENYLVYGGYHRRTNGSGIKMIDYNPAGNAFRIYGQALVDVVRRQQAIGPRRTAWSTDGLDHAKRLELTDIASLEVSDEITLRNIAAYREFQLLTREEFEGSSLAILDRFNPNNTFTTSTKIFTEEFQVQGDSLSSKLTWTLGAYYERRRPKGTPQLVNSTFGAALVTNASFLRGSQKALYGQATFDLGAAASALDGVSVTGGYRRTWDSSTSVNNQFRTATNACINVPGAFFPNCQVPVSGKDNVGTWTIGANWQVDSNLLLYTSYKRGFRPSAFNFFSPIPELTRTRPEFVQIAELGVKSDVDLGTMHARINAAYYHASYKDIQRAVGYYDPVRNLSGSLTQNAASAIAEGIEVEATLLPFPGFELSGNYAYSTAHYKEFISQTPAGPVDLSNVPFPSSPKHKFSVTALAQIPIAEALGRPSISVTYTWQGDYWGLNAVIEPYSEQPGYGLLDVRLDWDAIGGSPFDASLFATNITNNLYQASAGGTYNTLGFVPALYGEPRMYGLRLRYRFGS